jgi:hypothetical protein
MLTFSCRRNYSGCLRQQANNAIALRGDGQRLSPDANSSRSNAFGRFAGRPLLQIPAQLNGLLSCSLEHWRSQRWFLPFPSCFTSWSADPLSTWSKRSCPDKCYTHRIRTRVDPPCLVRTQHILLICAEICPLLNLRVRKESGVKKSLFSQNRFDNRSAS